MHPDNAHKTATKTRQQKPRVLGADRGAAPASGPDEMEHFVSYATDLLEELEGMAHELYLDELASSLSLCKSVAHLSARSKKADAEKTA